MTSVADVASAIQAYNEGVRAMREGDTDTAAARWKDAASTDPGMIPAMHNLVVYYEERDRTAEVIETYEAMLAYDPFDTDALIRLAAALRRAGRVEEAIARYEQAIAIYPYFRFWYDELATLHDSIGQTDEGETWRTRSQSLACDEAEMAFEDGVRQQRANNAELATAIFEAVLEELPANLDARLRLARCMAATGRDDDAIAQLDEAFELTDSAPALVLVHRAELHAAAGRNEPALHDLQAALDAVPNFGRAQRLLDRLSAE